MYFQSPNATRLSHASQTVDKSTKAVFYIIEIGQE